jgi:hypothetical protein
VATIGARVLGSKMTNIPSARNIEHGKPPRRAKLSPVSPLPRRILENAGRGMASDEGVGGGRWKNQSGDDTTPFRGCDVCDDDLIQDLEAVGSSRPSEKTGGRISQTHVYLFRTAF